MRVSYLLLSTLLFARYNDPQVKTYRDHEDTKISKDHEEELVFFVLFVGLRVFVVAF